MKKVLILAYDFPPYVSVGGLRPYSWFLYFKEYGLYPVVITRQWSNQYGNYMDYIAPSSSEETIIEETEEGTIIRTPYVPNLANRILLKYGASRFVLFRKAISSFYEVFQFVLNIGTKSQLYKEAKKYLQQNKVDVILATGDPFVLFRYASVLSKRYNIPWVADYRDLWSQNLHLRNRNLLKFFLAFQEKRLISTAGLITTVSFFLKEKINENNLKNIPVEVFPNGYIEADDSSYVSWSEEIKIDTLNIAFTGTIYKWHPILSVLSVINHFVESDIYVKIKINFYGVNIVGLNDVNVEMKIIDLIEKEFPALKKVVTVFSRISNQELLLQLKKNHLLLLFNDYLYMGTKIYDYLAAKRVVLFCYSDDADAKGLKEKYYTVKELPQTNNHLQADLIQETNSGVVVKDSKHLSCVLEDIYKEFMSKGFVECNSVGIQKYSRKIQVEKLSIALKMIIDKHIIYNV